MQIATLKVLPIDSIGSAGPCSGVLFTISFASCNDILKELSSSEVLTLK